MKIDIDLDVYKRLTELLRTDTETYGDVIRRLLDAHAPLPAPGEPKPPDVPESGAWQRQGLKLPTGARLRMRY